ncbi:hypothetical protein G7062_08090 [Erysipelothrix sp. HDW6C]|uniref:hypothetical protein n=1 Tax=Erysipelothrix sp. HDW6C TaxID=2714930 RepID=UPI00140D6085|nr:hypothetical protein [Erysipelothrix sp. HDW6C]QIK70250.1 hypothetical protein G7062_08090 [Erysipelothrix sp. HDW6C]
MTTLFEYDYTIRKEDYNDLNELSCEIKMNTMLGKIIIIFRYFAILVLSVIVITLLSGKEDVSSLNTLVICLVIYLVISDRRFILVITRRGLDKGFIKYPELFLGKRKCIFLDNKVVFENIELDTISEYDYKLFNRVTISSTHIYFEFQNQVLFMIPKVCIRSSEKEKELVDYLEFKGILIKSV